MIPFHGIGFGVLRYLSSLRQQLNSEALPQVSFNYLGDQSADSGRDTSHSSSDLTPKLIKDHLREDYASDWSSSCHDQNALLDLTAWTAHNRVNMTWCYNVTKLGAPAVENAVVEFEANFINLIQQLTTSKALSVLSKPILSPHSSTFLLHQLDEAFSRMWQTQTAENTFLLGASMGIVRGNQVVYRSARGFRDAQRSTQMSLDTQLYMGSLGKLYVVLLACKLCEEKVCSWDAPLDVRLTP